MKCSSDVSGCRYWIQKENSDLKKFHIYIYFFKINVAVSILLKFVIFNLYGELIILLIRC